MLLAHTIEEKYCGLIHKKLKNKHNNLLTIIIPRHINRTKTIQNDLHELVKTQTTNHIKK